MNQAFISVTGIMDLSKPFCFANAARFENLPQNHLHRFGNIHILLLLNRQIPCKSKSSIGFHYAEPSIPIGTLDIDSTPPAIINSDHPDLIIGCGLINSL
jgi:hypothetical protein